MSIDELFDQALAAQIAAGGDHDAENLKALVSLHERPTEEVFTRCLALLDAPDWERRRLGMRVLKEIGQGERPRPFAQRTLDALIPRVAMAPTVDELRQLVKAIGWQFDARAVDLLLSMSDHPDNGIRFHVAADLPGCAQLPDETLDPRALPALIKLMADPDHDVRYYATAAFEGDYPRLDTPAIRAALEARLSDEDEQVRSCARHALDFRDGRETPDGDKE
jgi:HEAT repeat protein